MNHSLFSKRAVFVVTSLLASTGASSAFAALGPADDRLLTNKTGWAADGSKALTDFAPDFLSSSGKEFRITDLQVRTMSPG